MSAIKFYPAKTGIILGLILSLLVPIVLFVATSYFWQYLYPIVPTFPAMIYPKYTPPGDSLYELVNLIALTSAAIGFLVIFASLRPRKSIPLGLIIGVFIYLFAGAVAANLSFGEISFPNSLYAVIIWPIFICNCWLY